jgi:hypothetical protein
MKIAFTNIELCFASRLTLSACKKKCLRVKLECHSCYVLASSIFLLIKHFFAPKKFWESSFLPPSRSQFYKSNLVLKIPYLVYLALDRSFLDLECNLCNFKL